LQLDRAHRGLHRRRRLPAVAEPGPALVGAPLVAGSAYRASPDEVTSRSMVDPLRRNDFIYGVVVTPFDEVL
jgi:hypothetical protein